MGNKISQADLMKYATTIREVEKASGLNFHPRLPNSNNIETKFDPAAWPGLDK
jgi:hypothetical protein